MNHYRRSIIKSFATFAISGLALRAADIVKPEDLLTTDDLQAYYNTTFKITPQASAKDPSVKNGPAGTKLSFISTGDEQRKHAGSLLVRQSDSPADARKACDAVRAKVANLANKIEDAPGVGEYAFWFGRQLNFVKGSTSFILSASGLTDHRDKAQSRAAALALAKKILERAK